MDGIELKTLKARYRGVAYSTFVEAHPHDWLVCTGGRPVHPVTRSAGPSLSALVTLHSPHATAPIAFPLSTKARPTGAITVGEGAGCAVVVAGAHLSDVHFVLMQEPSGWHVRSALQTTGTQHNGERLRSDQVRALRPGDTLKAGTATFTFHTPVSMYPLLQDLQ